ncbi:unnamed protein product [Linum tenue]|uniref:phosphoribosylanthranilate isomerase n=1 Tax=Linum tenue TaxID=586396 RepID=A0AAV0K4M8_9ROSI|nr:unnamed protein product [Linum tenue]
MRSPVVKMCGITSARDAPKSKRSISLSVAKEISKVARENGAQPVGVFVDDDAETIMRAAEVADLEFVQLHGGGSREALKQLVQDTRIVYVLHANKDGELQNQISDEESSLVDWILIDSATGGRYYHLHSCNQLAISNTVIVDDFSKFFTKCFA